MSEITRPFGLRIPLTSEGGIPLLLVAGALALLPGCGAPPALEVEEIPFTEADLRGLGPAQVEMLTLIAGVGAAVAGERVGELGATWMAREKHALRIRRLQAEVALERAGAHEEALRIQYESAPEWELEVRHLVLLAPRTAPESARNQAREGAEAALRRIRGGEDFAQVAGEISEEPGAARRGGLLQPGREGTWVPEFWRAARNLEPGDISPVVETTYGFHVLKLENRRAVPFEEARAAFVLTLGTRLHDPAAFQERLAERGTTGDPEALTALLDARGVEVTGNEAEALRREWERTILPFSHGFGFEVGMSRSRLRERSLDALGATGQGALLAREELRSLAPVLLPEIATVDRRGGA